MSESRKSMPFNLSMLLGLRIEETMVRQVKTKLPVSLILSAIMLFVVTSNLFAQSAPQVVTLKNGIQYIGQAATVTAYSAEQPNPWNAQQIALVDDGLRRVFFHRDSVGNLSPLDDDHPLANPSVFEIPQRVFEGTRGYGNLRVLQGFDEYGHRVVESRSTTDKRRFVQGITKITPRWCEVKTLVAPDPGKLRDWTMRIATSTVPPDVLRSLLEGQIRDRKNPADFLSVVDFFIESQQYGAALQELSFVSQRFPDMKELVKEQQTRIRQARARQWIRQVEQRRDVGQPVLAGEMLRAFDRSGIAGEILAEMANIQTELDQMAASIAESKLPIMALIDDFLVGALNDQLETNQIPMIEKFKQEIDAELNRENVARLDAFARFADDNQMTGLQKLSIAISGWFLGSNNATENFAVSQSFYPVRGIVVEYLTTANNMRRRKILEELTQYEGGEPKYLAAMISNLKPPKAPDLINVDRSKPLFFEFEIPGPKVNPGPQTFSYQVQLPPEYNPYRRYPCMVILPGDKNVDRQILLWCGPYNQKLGIRVGQAMRNGYIFVVVDWKQRGQFEYGYSALEHKTILTAIHRAMRQFSIDTDRVFLAGHGFGADAAYDIGISHPDLWAGVIGISGKIDKYPDLYREHKHVGLPIYSVVGEKDIASIKPSEGAWNRWLPSKRFFNATVVEYKGRSNEFFTEEIVEIFKWTEGQRRRLPDRGGFSFVGKIRRPGDNFFWFFELYGIPPDKVIPPNFFRAPFPRPLEISAELKSNQVNKFFVGPKNLGSGATLWLSPEFVDFQEKIEIAGRGSFKDFVSPSREILLEDVRGRSDRQHPFWANVHCKGISWHENVVGE